MPARLTAEGIEASKTSRRDYRELLLTARSFCATIRSVTRWLTGSPSRRPASTGVLPGVKVDTGTSPLPKGNGAMITVGLDGLGGRLSDYATRGAAFAKWRAVIDVRNASEYSLEANAHSQARYAALCQDNGIVP
ncbi:MAG: class I fructose-bisphosphate aldolase, partial [Nocardioides sp.]